MDGGGGMFQNVHNDESPCAVSLLIYVCKGYTYLKISDRYTWE